MSRLLLTIACALLLFVCDASAQAPSPEAMDAARKLVATLKIADQYRAALPQLLLKLRPVVAQDRPEIEHDYDAMTAPGSDIYAPFFASMTEQIAALYARELHRRRAAPDRSLLCSAGGSKVSGKVDALAQASAQIGQSANQKAADDLKQRLIEALRQKGHKL